MILEDFALAGKRAVVTGGGKGIGRGIALCLAEAGADVMVSARSTDEIESVAREVSALGRRGFACQIDVTQSGALERLGEQALADLGGIDIWVNNAGGLPDATARYLTKTTEDRWDAQMNLNLKAVWAGSVVAAELMAHDRDSSENEGVADGDQGSIVNISSVTAWGHQRKNGPYAASKAAVNSLTATLSVELAPTIRVNAVAPGPVLTDNFVQSTGYSEENREAFDRQMRIPLGRIGDARDIGSAVVFLASPAASWITGQVLKVDGGR